MVRRGAAHHTSRVYASRTIIIDCLLDVRVLKLPVVGLTVKVGVAKFMLLLLFWGKGNRNGFVKVMAAPLIFK